MNNILEFLPLGSIVELIGVKDVKFMVVSRAVLLGDEKKYFDYAACVYPIGVVEDKLTYFMKSDILRTVKLGFHDEDDELMISNIMDGLKELNL
ncbi:MAG: DUF4176 domain-containing protein [Lachnospiraceae bacterium]|nr:DUF4176 domain-containing protein [Lachnospiraceae bacterium]